MTIEHVLAVDPVADFDAVRRPRPAGKQGGPKGRPVFRYSVERRWVRVPGRAVTMSYDPEYGNTRGRPPVPVDRAAVPL